MVNTPAQVDLPPPPSSTACSDPRGRQLVEAAYELLDEAGLDGLTIRAVLTRTGLGRRAFYENFASKDELLLVVFAQSIRRVAVYYRAMAEALPGPLMQLRLIVTSLTLGVAGSGISASAIRIATPQRLAAISREHMRLAESRPGALKAALAPLRALLVEVLRAGIASGEMKEGDPELRATLIYNLLSTTAHTEFLAANDEAPDPARRLRLAFELWEFCRRAIAT